MDDSKQPTRLLVVCGFNGCRYSWQANVHADDQTNPNLKFFCPLCRRQSGKLANRGGVATVNPPLVGEALNRATYA